MSAHSTFVPVPLAWPASERLATTPQADVDRTSELTRRLRAGDEAAWREFHTTYTQRLFRYLLVVTAGREELAREVLQQTYLRAVRHMRSFETEDALWSWMTVLARSAFVDEMRRESRRAGLLERWFSWSGLHAPPKVPNDETEARLRESMESALAELPAAERALLDRKYIEGCSVREIAAALGQTEKAIEARLARARQSLRARTLDRLRNETKD